MATVIETKTIGLDITQGGSFDNTEILNNQLVLKKINADSDIYQNSGNWVSRIIDIGDNFRSFDKLVITNTDTSSAYVTIETRTSENGLDFNNWTLLSEDNSILSDKKRYIQCRINLYAGTEASESKFTELVEENDFVKIESYGNTGYIDIKITTNTGNVDYKAYASTQFSSSYSAWRAFNQVYNDSYRSRTNSNEYLTMVFSEEKNISKYEVSSLLLNTAPTKFILQGSKDTTDGTNGTWVDIETRDNLSWEVNETKEFTLNNPVKFKAFRLHLVQNSGLESYFAIAEWRFFEYSGKLITINRDYEFDMVKDESWNQEGTLLRKNLTRTDWLRIDKINVK